MQPNKAAGITNSEDHDYSAPKGAVRSVSALFAKTCPKTMDQFGKSQVHVLLYQCLYFMYSLHDMLLSLDQYDHSCTA